MKRLGLAKTELTDNVGQLPFVVCQAERSAASDR
jgi:hypothetical protein